eukprot:13745628-Ditylum_brightwellii.AAC.1
MNPIVLDPSTCPGIPQARQPSSFPVDEICMVHMSPFRENIFGNGECGIIFGGAIRWGKRLFPTHGNGKLLSAMGVIVFGNVAFGVGALKSAKRCNLTHCAMDGAGTQFCVRAGTHGCLGGCRIWGG